MMERYNLHSTRGQEICVPVQLQMAGDRERNSQDLGSSHPDPMQVTFQSDSTSDLDSELNLSDIFKNSDVETGSPSKHTVQRNLDQQGHSVDGVVENKKVVDQNESNRQILKQLSQLGERISSMEQGGRTCKKSSDKSKIKNAGKVKHTQKAAQGRSVSQGLGGVSNCIHPTFPTPGQIKNDELIQQQVQERLKQLSENLSQGKEKIKSQRGGSVDVYVNTRVKWPHGFVLSGTNKERVTYDQLSPVQWMAGFCRTMSDQPDTKIREHMLDYIIQMLRISHGRRQRPAMQYCSAVWSRGKLVVGQIVIRLNAYGMPIYRDMLLPPPEKGQKGQDKNQQSGKVLPCLYFNKNTCVQKSSHETRGVLYRHICSACICSFTSRLS